MTINDLDTTQLAAQAQADTDAATVVQDKTTLTADETKAAGSLSTAQDAKAALGAALRAIGKPYVRITGTGVVVVTPTDSGVLETVAVAGTATVPVPVPPN